ncbi:hypothetical protein [Mangrovimonas sp. YM274]|uniref:hypothetical protein n=1 Tax=Mangrovimonas sp. YM274 TaxID=3070660 RepID=UPI0027DD0E6A|nr:hypothetical protein [Mangrovimonas sp. YM274]WMI68893.1 hypothetical protein RBH95_00655 [Mangrovimonas sp. YM274]
MKLPTYLLILSLFVVACSGSRQASKLDKPVQNESLKLFSGRYNIVGNEYHMKLRFRKQYDHLDSIYFKGKMVRLDTINSVKQHYYFSTTKPYAGMSMKDSEIADTNYYLYFPVEYQDSIYDNSLKFYSTYEGKFHEGAVKVKQDSIFELIIK